MQPLAATYDPRAVEADSRAFWASLGLPPTEGPLGPANGSLVRLVSGPVPGEEPSLANVVRLARLDAEARWLARSGRRVSGALRLPLSWVEADSPNATLGSLGIWFAGGVFRSAQPREAALRRTLLERLAADRILVSRSVPVQVCPNCRRPNSPESVVYQPEEGSAYLVRFPLANTDPPVSLLVWTDAAWKLLAASALLASPKLPYVVLRRTTASGGERVLCSKSSLARLARWLPEAHWEVLEERAGSALEGQGYVHPLAVEHPALSNLPPPGGTVIGSEDVEDSGTGLLLLTPAHGVVDAEVAHRLGVPGWPVLGTDGEMTRAIHHKYAGLSREDAEAFIVRDLIDDGAIFAQLSVRRGVPRCSRCGSALLWTPARVWMLDPGRLPPERLQMFRRVLPGAVMAEPHASLPWPVSEFASEPGEGSVALSECPQCENLAPDTAPPACSCGGRRTVVTRRLLADFEEALAAWASVDSFPDGTAVRLVVPDRRRGPALLHHLVAMHAARRRPGDLRLVPVLSVPPVGLGLGADEPIDAARSALLRTRRIPAGRATLEGNRRQEAVRLRRIWRTCGFLLERSLSAGEGADLGAVAIQFSSLLEEDRAFLSTFERLRLEVQRAFEEGRWGEGLDRLLRFFEGDLRAGYLRLVAGRLSLPGAPPIKQSALRSLLYVVPTWIGLYAPAAPFTAEAIWRAFQGDGASVFESALPPAQESWIDANLETSYARWRSVVGALDRARAGLGLAPLEHLPSVALVVSDEELGASLRAQIPVLARLVNADSFEVGSPDHPWTGRHVELRPRLPEIHRAFGTRAARIARIVQGLPPKRLLDGMRAGGVSVVLDGASVTLQPSMFESVESLPEGTVPIPWSGGQFFVSLPRPLEAAKLGPRPILSLESHRLVRSIARRLVTLPLDAAPGEAIIRVAGTMRAELAEQAVPLARTLHLSKVRVDEPTDAFPANETHSGRTGRGVAWSVWIPGVPRPTRPPKSHRRRSAGRRRAPVTSGAAIVPEEQLEYLSEASRLREQALRELLADLDTTPVGPALGLTKLGSVWDRGYRDRASIAAAPFAEIAALPGFGTDVARELIRAVGGSPPPRPPRPLRPTSVDPVAEPKNGSARSLDATIPAAVGLARPLGGPRASAGVSGVPPPSRDMEEPPVPPPPPLTRDEFVPPDPIRSPTPPERADPEVLPSTPTQVAPKEVRPEPALERISGIDRRSPPPPEAPPPLEPAAPTPPVADRPVEPAVAQEAVVGTPPEATRETSSAPELLEPVPEVHSIESAEIVPAEPSSPDLEASGPQPEPPGAATAEPSEPSAVSEASPPVLPVPEDPAGELSATRDAPISRMGEESNIGANPPTSTDGEEIATEASAPDAPDKTPVPPAGSEGDPEAESLGSGRPGGITDSVSEEASPPPAASRDDRDPPDAGRPPEGPGPVVPPVPPSSDPETPIVLPPTEARPVEAQPPSTDPAESELIPERTESAPAVDRIETGGAPEDPAEPVPQAEIHTRVHPAVTEALPATTEVSTTAETDAEHLDDPTALATDPSPETGPAPSESITVEEGIILLESPTLDQARAPFLEATSAGHRGLWLTREPPDRIRLHLHRRDVDVAWISSLSRPGAIRPSDLAGISQRILLALREGRATTVMFEGIEYLVSLHSAERALPALREIDSEARGRHARVWVALNPDLIPGPELQALRSGTDSRTIAAEPSAPTS